MSLSYPNIPNAPGFRQKPPTPKRRKPAVVTQPRTFSEVQEGVNLIANAVRPTLGPRPRLVAYERVIRTEAPEILDDGGTIGRRITEVRPRGQDVGAQFMRQALWKMHQESGDGTTTMAVMYQVLLNEGIRYVTRLGCNSMLLREGLEKGLAAILALLDELSTPLAGRAAIAGMAAGMCQVDTELAEVLGEIFDVVGHEGLIVVEKGTRLNLEREYVEGTYWKLSGWMSRLQVADWSEHRTLFEDPAILITDLTISDHRQLVPVLDRSLKAGVKRLIILAKKLSDDAIGLLMTNAKAKTIETLAVRTPKVAEMDQVAVMRDIAAMCGGRPFYSATSDSLDDFRVEDLGHARRAWATDSLFGLFGGKGDPRTLRQHLASVRAALPNAPDDNEKKKLQERLGQLAGGTAILRVGGAALTAIETRTTLADRAVKSLRNAILGGVVAGGGAALLHAQSVLKTLPVETEEDAAAYRILARVLEEPMRTIAYNAGYQPDVVIEKAKASPPGYGFEARSGKIVDLREAKIMDAVPVLKLALQVAVSGAATALTTDVIIHHKLPEISIEP
jgi:chaperonin GroEL